MNYIFKALILKGSKIRSTYVSFAQKEKTRLEALVASTAQEITEREKEVARLKGDPDFTPFISMD